MPELEEKIKILMVEDDVESMKDVKAHLEEDLNYTVTMSAEIDLPSRLAHTRFNLILLDLMIRPFSIKEQGVRVETLHFDDVNWRETGLEFLKRFKRGDYWRSDEHGTPPETPVIILSAIADTFVEIHPEVQELTAQYIEKPFRLSDFDRQLQEVLMKGM